MGFELVDLGDPTHSVEVNAWNWRPTLEILRALGMLTPDRLEILGFNGGAEVTAAEASAIAQRLRTEVLPNLQPQGRVLYDLTITAAPDDGTFHRAPDTQWQNYSASAEWLATFAEFCATCQGFAVE